MLKHNYTPNDHLLYEFLNICDRYHHPAYLKTVIDHFVLNKQVRLNGENFAYYIQILSNFKETKDYIKNLISASFDFGFPIRAEFYEFLIYNNLVEGNFKEFEANINELKERYKTDYKDEESRSRAQFEGNLLLIRNFNEFYSNLNYKQKLGLKNDEHDERAFQIFKDNSEGVYQIIQLLIEENKMNKNWLENVEFVREIITFYENKKDYQQLTALYRAMRDSNKAHNYLTKHNFIKYIKMIQQERREFVNPFELFDHVLKNLEFGEVFEFVRYENLPFLQKIFYSNGLAEQFENFLRIVATDEVMDRLYEMDRKKLWGFLNRDKLKTRRG
jgi:hypothetical protein